MGKRRDSTCDYANSCKARNNPAEFSDKVTSKSSLGWRFIITVVSWFILGKAVSSSMFFVGVFLFAIPVLQNCMEFTPGNRLRNKIRQAEIIISAFWVIFSFLGMAGVFVFSSNDNTIIQTADDFMAFTIRDLPVDYVLRALLTVVGVTFVDFLCRLTSLDVKNDEMTAEMQGV